MTISQAFAGVSEQEKARRMQMIDRLNALWVRAQRSDDEAEKTRIDKRIKRILREAQPWMKDIAYFLY